jgi:GNAT superfamily N-acetyltransferase
MELAFQFLDVGKIEPQTRKEIEILDHLAYSDAKPGKENWPSEWANPSWMILGRLDGLLVSQLCLLKREILVGGKKVETAGVGGVATHPDWQRKGFAKQLMHYTETILRNELQCPFALLLCDGMPCSIYRNAGWKDAAEYIVYREDRISYPFKTNVMVFETSKSTFPQGEIDLCGLPW